MRRGDATERLDAWYNHPRYTLLNERLDQAPFAAALLNDLLQSIAGGATPKRNDASLYADSGVKFLRILNIDDGEILDRDLKYITGEVHQKDLSRSQLAAGDVLMTITGRVGSAAVVAAEHLPANINQHIARLRINPAQCRPEFLSEWLNCPAGQELSNRYVSGGTRAALDYGAIRNLRIPLPPIDIQDELVAAMDAARAERNAMLAEADGLLAGIDGFVLAALGINLNSAQRNTFAVRIARSGNFRIDPDFHSLKFRTIRGEIENGRYPAKRIDGICDLITTGFAAGRQDQAFDYESGVPHIRPLNFDTYGQLSLANTKFVPRESVSAVNWLVGGEVLFNNTNSTDQVGKSAVFAFDQPCACSNHVTRMRPLPGNHPEYIASVLNALRRLGYLGLLSTNFNNQAGINTTTLRQLRIPQPPQEIQQAIAAEIVRRRQEARRLRTAAEACWQAAKRRFEDSVLL